MVTVTLFLRLARRRRFRVDRFWGDFTDEGLGLWAVGIGPKGGCCDRFVSIAEGTSARLSLNRKRFEPFGGKNV
jgi:hypothetical protein